MTKTIQPTNHTDYEVRRKLFKAVIYFELSLSFLACQIEEIRAWSSTSLFALQVIVFWQKALILHVSNHDYL